jgi:hypothetical protein
MRGDPVGGFIAAINAAGQSRRSDTQVAEEKNNENAMDESK